MSEATGNAPAGYLRKIVSMTTIGDQMTLTTEEASLVDIFEDVNYNGTLPLEDTPFSEFIDGSSSRSSFANSTYTFDLVNFPVGQGVTLTGQINFTPEVDFEFVSRNKTIENLVIGIDTEVTSNLTLTLLEAQSISGEKTWFERKLRPITFWVPTPAGPIPIIIVPEFEIYSNYTIENKDMSVGLTNSGTIRTAARYINGQWVNDSRNGLSLSNTTLQSKFEVSGDITVGGLRFDFDLYDLEIAQAFLKGEVKAGFLASQSECYIEGNFNVQGGLDLALLEHIGIESDNFSLNRSFLSNKLDLGLCIEKDTDEDGIADDNDNCPFTPNASQNDTDYDGIGDVCDNCPSSWNDAQHDTDNDGIGDICDDFDDSEVQCTDQVQISIISSQDNDVEKKTYHIIRITPPCGETVDITQSLSQSAGDICITSGPIIGGGPNGIAPLGKNVGFLVSRKWCPEFHDFVMRINYGTFPNYNGSGLSNCLTIRDYVCPDRINSEELTLQKILNSQPNSASLISKSEIKDEVARVSQIYPNPFHKETILSVYPNPTNQTVTVDYYLSSRQNTHLYLMDFSGRIIQEFRNKNEDKGQNTQKIIFEKRLPHGLYNVVLKTEEGIISKRVVYQKE